MNVIVYIFGIGINMAMNMIRKNNSEKHTNIFQIFKDDACVSSHNPVNDIYINPNINISINGNRYGSFA